MKENEQKIKVMARLSILEKDSDKTIKHNDKYNCSFYSFIDNGFERHLTIFWSDEIMYTSDTENPSTHTINFIDFLKEFEMESD